MDGPLFDGKTEQRPLRPYQAEAVELLRQSLATGHKRPILQAPTGYGKTRLAAEIVNRALARGKRVVFTVPALSLIDQTLEAFHRDGVRDMGVIQANHVETDWSRPVQIASVQTLERRSYPQADLVLIDECHKVFKHTLKWMAHPEWQKIPFIGLSATPWTRGLGKHYDDLIISATTQELIDQNYLSPFRVFAPAHPDLSGVRTVAGDFNLDDLGGAMNKAPLIADVVETWILRGEGRPTLCFAVDCAHGRHLQERFEAAGVKSAYIDANTPTSERLIIRDRLHAGKISVVCNIGTLTTGVDWDVRCIILARPTRSEMLFVQIVGRGLRTATGKTDCLILDHADNHARLGFVTDIGHEMLDNGARVNAEAKRKPLPKECPKCTFLRAPGQHVCPNCGFKPKAKSQDVATQSGELAEITRSAKKLHRAGMIQMRGKNILLGDFFGMLKHYAAQHGYKPGWAPNQYRQATGTWPNYYRDVVPCQPVPEVLSWIRSRQIAYAKSRKPTQAAAQ
jgi:DNA repair protein RadD